MYLHALRTESAKVKTSNFVILLLHFQCVFFCKRCNVQKKQCNEIKKQCDALSEPLRWFDLSIAMVSLIIYGKFMLIAT